MKIRHIFFISFLILGLSACTELGPKINLVETNRVVLIEEFTGVRCVNCPDGSAKLEDLLEIHGDKLVAVSIHGGIFSDPFDESNYDFRTDDGDDLIGYLNAPNAGPLGYPAAIVNRKWFPAEQDRMVFLNSWAGYIQSELQEAPVARIDVEKDYNPDTRKLDLGINLFFFEAIEGNVNLTVLITEDNITDVQDSLDGKLTEYKHKHVLRDVINNDYRGDLIGEGIAESSSNTLNYSYELSSDWDIANCHVVVFISKNDGGTLDVLQAGEISVE